MLTTRLSQVLEGVFHLAGVIPADVDDAVRTALLQSIADRYRFAHAYYAWPALLTIEQRYFRPLWSASTTYAAGAEVYSEAAGAYYAANSAPNTPAAGESPVSHPTKWTVLDAFHRYVDAEQPGLAAIEAVVGAWDRDPRTDARARPLRFALGAEGVTFAPDVGVTSVWLQYRGRPRDFAAEIYSATQAYAAGRAVYFPTIGDVYVSATATVAGETPLTHASKWTLQPFPAFLELAVKAGAYSDYLTGEERPVAAARWDSRFIELLDEQVWQLTKLQGQTGRAQVRPTR